MDWSYSMSKVYVYYYDNQQRILVGSGGTRGSPATARNGLHLPGGTVGLRKSTIAKAVGQAGALREVGEEFGKVRMAALQSLTTSTTAVYHGKVYGRLAAAEYVYFLIVKLTDKIMAEMIGPITDGEGPASDSPFSACSAVSVPVAKQSFQAHGNDWFVDGLQFLPFAVA